MPSTSAVRGTSGAAGAGADGEGVGAVHVVV